MISEQGKPTTEPKKNRNRPRNATEIKNNERATRLRMKETVNYAPSPSIPSKAEDTASTHDIPVKRYYSRHVSIALREITCNQPTRRPFIRLQHLRPVYGGAQRARLGFATQLKTIKLMSNKKAVRQAKSNAWSTTIPTSSREHEVRCYKSIEHTTLVPISKIRTKKGGPKGTSAKSSTPGSATIDRQVLERYAVAQMNHDILSRRYSHLLR